MSNAIATVDAGSGLKVIDWPSLSPNSRQAQIIAQNLDGEVMNEMDLIHVTTPLGGATTWSVDNNGNVESTDEIVGLLVGIGKRGVLWPSEDPTEQRPVLVTNDLQVAYRVSDDLGPNIKAEVLERFRVGDRRYDWAAISTSPEFGFGSARGGSGKRVKESRILAILRQGETWPILVTVGGGSLRNWLPFQKRLPCFPWEAVIGLKLTRAKSKGGQPFSQIVPRLVGQVSEAHGEMARRIYAEPLRQMFSAAPIGGTVAKTADGDEE